MKTEWESRVLLQILYVLCMSPVASLDAKLQKERRRAGRGEGVGKHTHPLFLSLKPPGKGLQLIPKSFRYKA